MVLGTPIIQTLNKYIFQTANHPKISNNVSLHCFPCKAEHEMLGVIISFGAEFPQFGKGSPALSSVCSMPQHKTNEKVPVTYLDSQPLVCHIIIILSNVCMYAP